MANVLLYAPELTGHPQVYCRVIGEILLDHGHNVIVAAGSDADNYVAVWQDLRRLRDFESFYFIDTRVFSGSGHAHLSAEELIHLQRKTRTDSTLFIEGDWFREQFFRIASGHAPSLIGHNASIFGRSCEWIPGESPYSGHTLNPEWYAIKRRIKRWRTRLRSPETDPNVFYKRTVLDKRLVDVFITKDERLAETLDGAVVWMPEIYRVLGASAQERRFADWDRHAEAIKGYFDQAGPQNVLLYFGTGTRYKGYDFFLKLAEFDPSVYAIHAGAPLRKANRSAMLFDVDVIRKTLIDQGRLYETNGFIGSQDLIDLLFDSIHSFVSTHRLTLSSGTMLHALEYGKPVLVPSTGLVGHRAITGILGRTYKYMDVEDMGASWRLLRKQDPALYKDSIDRFMQKFSREAVARTFLHALSV